MALPGHGANTRSFYKTCGACLGKVDYHPLIPPSALRLAAAAAAAAMYYYQGPPTWVFSAFSLTACIMNLIPLPWHLEAWNVGTCLFMIWTAIANMIFFINSIIWRGNVHNSAPVWCDIVTHFMVGFNTAVPACCLCISRRLYSIASVKSVTKTKSDQRRAILGDLAIGLGIPILSIPLQYVVQGHRYDILEDVGCLSETYETPVAIVLYNLPPLLIGCVSAVYCTLAIRAFHHCRLQFKELLSSSNNLNANRYLRLMCLAGTDLVLTIPLTVFVLVANSRVGIQPWISWADTHSNFSRVREVPGIFWRSDPWNVASIELLRWSTVGAGFIFFAFFGFADEARKHYRLALQSVAKRVGISTLGTGTLSSNGTSKGQSSYSRGALPVFVKKQVSRKRDSLDSFSDTMDLDGSLGALTYDGSKVSAKSFGDLSTEKSFGAISFGDVGGLLSEKKGDDFLESPISYSGSSSSGSEHGGLSRPLTPISDDADDIEVSSLHRASMYVLPAIPSAARTHVSRTSDVVDPANAV
ncbi:unnamed protein product [Mycena citricolor]|uniref:Pheromone receptor n=1 Tax=Mycena citricolor TaxID=2018698 RepID=A0AAD2H8B5_9AGAR|nr:unnamed protein product [Mycena citricolor]